MNFANFQTDNFIKGKLSIYNLKIIVGNVSIELVIYYELIIL